MKEFALEGEKYTPLSVWTILQEDSELEGDIDERIDVAVALERLPHDERVFIRMVAAGYSASDALHAAGPDVDQNGTRLRKTILTKLANILNGE